MLKILKYIHIIENKMLRFMPSAVLLMTAKMKKNTMMRMSEKSQKEK